MRIAGEVELKIVELPDALEITVAREDGLLESLLGPVVAATVLWLFWRTGSTWARVIAGCATVSVVLAFVANKIQGRETILRVTSDELSAEGNLRRLTSTRASVPVSEIISIGYYIGGEGNPGGFCAKRKWNSICLLPGVSEEQADSIVDSIAGKFPELPIHRSNDDSQELISLGIADAGRKSTDRG